jgi:hypothetical protein
VGDGTVGRRGGGWGWRGGTINEDPTMKMIDGVTPSPYRATGRVMDDPFEMEEGSTCAVLRHCLRLDMED